MTPRFRRAARLCAALALSSLLFGCATLYRDSATFRQLHSLVGQNRFDEAVELLRSTQETMYRDKDLVLYYLDIGMLFHYAGEYELSNQALSLAEDAIDDLFTVSVSRATASLLLNDNVLEYSGEDYEDLYINVFKALNYLALGESSDAFVEVRRVDEKLNFLEDKYSDLAASMNNAEEAQTSFRSGTTKFHNSAVARLMSLVLYELDRKFDDARIDLQKISEAWETQPEIYRFARPEVSVAPSLSSRPVRFLSFVGVSPTKKANTYRIRTEENVLIIAVTNERSGESLEVEIDRIAWRGVPEGFHFKFELPYMEVRGTSVAAVSLWIDGELVNEMQLFESIENIALATYEVKQPLIYLKGISRAVIKGLAAARAKREIATRVESPLLSLLGTIATDVAVDASEAADLRTSQFVPAQAYFAEIALPAGLHDVVFEYRDASGGLVYRDQRGSVEVGETARLVESFYLR